jgi:hypothetical protein
MADAMRCQRTVHTNCKSSTDHAQHATHQEIIETPAFICGPSILESAPIRVGHHIRILPPEGVDKPAAQQLLPKRVPLFLGPSESLPAWLQLPAYSSNRLLRNLVSTPRAFSCFPKLHKNPVVGKPIVACHSSHLAPISKWIAKNPLG